jgi:hypothetical protein
MVYNHADIALKPSALTMEEAKTVPLVAWRSALSDRRILHSLSRSAAHC